MSRNAETDDIDELDGVCALTDMLDDFSKPAAQSNPKDEAPGQTQAPALAEGDEDPLSDDFVAELTKNMESFMSQIGAGDATPPAPGGGAEASAGPNEDELMRQFAQLLTGGAEAADSAPKEAGSAPAGGSGNFQDVIQATMDKLKQSKQSAGSSDPLGGMGGDNDLSQLLAALGSGENGEMPDLTKMLSSMMEDLMSKEVLYEPLKDMHTRFPEFLASEKGKKLPDDERSRYEKQRDLMAEIIAAYEAPKYDDSNPEQRKRVSVLVTKVRVH